MHWVHSFFQKSIPSVENSVDPDHLAIIGIFKNIYKQDKYTTWEVLAKTNKHKKNIFLPLWATEMSCSVMLSINRGSYMSANVLLNLLNELGKRDKMRGLPSILSLFCNKFNKFDNTRARMLDSILILLQYVISLPDASDVIW